MARNKRHKGATRDPGGFLTLPWSVMDSAAYQGLSHPARALLFELARQFRGDDNGRLLLTEAYLRERGWKSADVISRAKAELIDAGFLHMTVRGRRPNKAAWYAVTWMPLDKLDGYDPGAGLTFERSAYRNRAQLQNTPLTPSRGVQTPPIAPSGGVESPPPTPPDGAMRAAFDRRSTPPDGDPLEKPSTPAVLSSAVGAAVGDRSKVRAAQPETEVL